MRTNVVVGCVTNLPGVWIFCSFTAAAIAMAYVYQLTFFTACMAIQGDWEAAGRHCILLVVVHDPPPPAGDQQTDASNNGTLAK